MKTKRNESEKTIEQEIEKFSNHRFNWSVLLLGYTWFFWKRMYGFGTILFLISLLTTISIVTIRFPVFLDGWDFMVKGGSAFDFEVFVWVILLFVPNYVFSFFADDLYVKKLKKQQSQITAEENKLNKIGFVLFSVLLYLFIFFISLPFLIPIF